MNVRELMLCEHVCDGCPCKGANKQHFYEFRCMNPECRCKNSCPVASLTPKTYDKAKINHYSKHDKTTGVFTKGDFFGSELKGTSTFTRGPSHLSKTSNPCGTWIPFKIVDNSGKVWWDPAWLSPEQSLQPVEKLVEAWGEEYRERLTEARRIWQKDRDNASHSRA